MAIADSAESEPETVCTFVSVNSSFKGKRILKIEGAVPIGRQTDGQEPPSNSLRFPSKVVSRQHAVVIAADGKLFIQDTKSSSGTFLNGQRLSPQGQESPRVELHDGDIIKLGEDCEVNGVLHQSVAMRVVFGEGGRRMTGESFDALEGEGEYIDFSMDPQVQANVNAEFNIIWSSLTDGLDAPLNRLRYFVQGIE
ncbi:hypothetical protein HK104_004076 [Borealophlyctis nickersoniae]|nr:hypothetical protein HK104_004076 [Borealophlyctis nickersoniae]